MHRTTQSGHRYRFSRKLDHVSNEAALALNRGQTQEHAQCTRTRSPAAKISRAKT